MDWGDDIKNLCTLAAEWKDAVQELDDAMERIQLACDRVEERRKDLKAAASVFGVGASKEEPLRDALAGLEQAYVFQGEVEDAFDRAIEAEAQAWGKVRSSRDPA